MEKLTENETYNMEKEVKNFDTNRHLFLKPPLEAYLFIPNDFQIIEVNKDKPQKSLRRIFEGNFEFNQYETTKLNELYKEINKYNSNPKNIKTHFNINQIKKYEVLRFLQATSFKINETIKLLIDHLNWKNSKFPNFQIRLKTLEILNEGFIYVHGRDCQYRPILVVNAGVYMRIKDKYTFDDWENFIIFFMKFLFENTLISGQVENWNIITDVRNVSIYSIPGDFKKIMNLLSFNYRCRLFVNYIFGMSKFLNIVWKLVQVFLDDTAKKKIKFINDSNKDDIFTYINRCQVEKKYGGDAEDKKGEFFPGFMPSKKFLLNSQDKDKYLVSKENYKLLCNQGKIAQPNNIILEELEKSNSEFNLLKESEKGSTLNIEDNINDRKYHLKIISNEENYKNNSFNLINGKNLRKSMENSTIYKDNEYFEELRKNVRCEIEESIYFYINFLKLDENVLFKKVHKSSSFSLLKNQF